MSDTLGPIRALETLRHFWRRLQPDAMRVKRQYRHHTGMPLDLDAPRSLSEKTCWLKLYGMTPLHSFCTDKITAPAYIASRLGPGHVPERIFATYDVADLTPERIGRAACMIKTNHDSGGIFRVDDAAETDWDDLRDRITRRLQQNFYPGHRERQYKSIRPGIVVEELLTPGNRAIISDLRVYCFNGTPKFIRLTQIDVSCIPTKKILGAGFDLDWSPLPWGYPTDMVGHVAERPAGLDEVIDQARNLAEPFPFVRVDFLEAQEHFLVGELTFTPSGGIKPFRPFEADLALGDGLDLQPHGQDWSHHLEVAKKHLDQCKIR